MKPSTWHFLLGYIVGSLFGLFQLFGLVKGFGGKGRPMTAAA